jgi:hypothetical protein
VLGESVEQLEPPAGLRERVLATVDEESGRAPAGARRRRPLSRLILRPAAGLAALAVAGAGVAGYVIRDEEGEGGTETVPIETAAMSGSLVVSPDSATLEVSGMPQLSKGAVYQVWVGEGGSARPVSTFVPDPQGQATAAVPESLDTGDSVMVTSEPKPGRSVPSGPPLLTARVD